MITINLTYWQFFIFITLVVISLFLLKLMLYYILKTIRKHKLKNYDKNKKVELLKNFQLLQKKRK